MTSTNDFNQGDHMSGVTMATTTLEYVTPEKAREYLARNKNVRPVKAWWARALATIIRRGEWSVTPGGLGFDRGGDLVDGQHRLLAIIEADVGCWINVTRDLSDAEVAALDQGMKRHLHHVLGQDQKIVQVVSLAIRVVCGTNRPAVGLAREVSAGPLGDALRDLTASAGSRAAFYTSAAMRLGAAANMIRYPQYREYVIGLYRKLSLGDYADLPPIGYAIVRQVEKGRVRVSGDRYDALCRALALYDYNRRHLAKIQVKDSAVGIEEIRAILRPVME